VRGSQKFAARFNNQIDVHDRWLIMEVLEVVTKKFYKLDEKILEGENVIKTFIVVHEFSQ